MAEEQKSRLQRAGDTAIGAAIAALVVGFFALLWSTSTTVNTNLSTLNLKTENATKELSAARDVLTKAVADLQVEKLDERIKYLEQRTLEQQKSIQSLAESVAAKHPDLGRSLSGTVPENPKFPMKNEKAEDQVSKLRLQIKEKAAAY